MQQLELNVSGPIRIQSRVGNDGVLSLRVPIGADEANREVTVTISPANGDGSNAVAADWHEFVRQTYGSCAGLGLDEPPDLPLQDRDPT